MKSTWLILVSVLAVNAAVACGGDDDDDDDNGTGGSSSGGTSGGSSVTDACENPSDLNAVNDATYNLGGAGGATNFSGVVGSCGLDCLAAGNNDAVIQCALDCVNLATDNAVSEDCTGCFTASAICARDNCLGACLTDPAGEACFTCRCEAGCEDDFGVCAGSGVTRPACP